MAMAFEQQPKESDRAFAAFKIYLELGAERSLVRVADKLSSHGTARAERRPETAARDCRPSARHAKARHRSFPRRGRSWGAKASRMATEAQTRSASPTGEQRASSPEVSRNAVPRMPSVSPRRGSVWSGTRPQDGFGSLAGCRTRSATGANRKACAADCGSGAQRSASRRVCRRARGEPGRQLGGKEPTGNRERGAARGDGDDETHGAFGGLADGDGHGGSGDGVEDVCVHDVFVLLWAYCPFMKPRGAAGRAVGGISGGHRAAPRPESRANLVVFGVWREPAHVEFIREFLK